METILIAIVGILISACIAKIFIYQERVRRLREDFKDIAY